MFTVLSNTRNSNLYLMAVLAIVVAALLTLAIAPSISLHNSTAIPVTGAQNADLAFRRGEWTTGASAYQAYLDQRYGEQHLGKAPNPQAAYIEFRHGEQTTGVSAAKAYLDFRRGEWSGK
ncbi:MAG TPA: hypothetical protein VK249_29190 [Anaerolineales bacterium]|nr:hypothetical protein [Anaerolineales bacterium]